MQAGDVILKVDGRNVEGSAEVTRVIGNTKPGSKVTLSIWRGGTTRDVAVTIGEFKDDKPAAVKTGVKPKPEAAPGRLGIAASDLNAEQKKELKVSAGVFIEAVQGPAASVVQAGDIILRINNSDVSSAKQFNDVVGKLDLKRPVALLVRNEEGSRFVTFRPDSD